MGKVLDLVEQFFLRAQHDGSLFLDPELDIFGPIAAEQPLFAAWRRYTMEEDIILSPDGRTRADKAFSVETHSAGTASPC